MIMAMKESGIEWVGLIPDDWKIAKNNRLFNISKQLVNENWKNTQLLSLTKSGIIEKNINDGGGKQPESFGTYQYVEKDDIVLCLFDIDVSAVFSDRSKYDGMISPAYRVMKCTDAILPVYAKWWFDAVNIGRYYLIYTKSLRKTIDADGFGNILTVVPPLSEQQAIADYLDKTCSKIDEIIAEAKASIDEYKELKQSVIFEAVTKGLSYKGCSNEKIDWADEICPYWDVRQIRYLYELRKETNDKPLSEVNLISLYTDKGVIQHSDIGTENTTGNRAVSAEGYKIVYPNDIVVNIILCWMGAMGRSDYYGVTSPAYDIYKPIDETKVSSRYYHYLFRTDRFAKKCYTVGRGIMMMRWRTYSSEFRSIKVPVPTKTEQEEIADFLDKRTAEIDSLIAEKESLINDLEAYKKSLIYEVVTGKRRVV